MPQATPAADRPRAEACVHTPPALLEGVHLPSLQWHDSSDRILPVSCTSAGKKQHLLLWHASQHWNILAVKLWSCNYCESTYLPWWCSGSWQGLEQASQTV